MGRSVSTPSGAKLVAYSHIELDDEDGNPMDADECSWEWDSYKEGVTERLTAAYPSLRPCNEWLSNEDHAILENKFAKFGISEYCGLVSIWAVKQDYLEPSEDAMADNWLSQIANSFDANFSTLRCEGRFSNGEAVFRQVA